MNKNELRQIIAASKHKDWALKVSITFNFQPINEQYSFIGIPSIYEYVNKQKKGWAILLNQKETSFIKDNSIYFDQSLSMLEQVINELANNSDIPALWTNFDRYVARRSKYIVPFEHSITEFLLDLHEISEPMFNSAIEYFRGIPNLSNSKSSDDFKGLLLAYEFEMKDQTDILERRSREEKSLGTIRAEAQRQLEETEKDVIEIIRKLDDSFIEKIMELEKLKKNKLAEIDEMIFVSNENIKSHQETYIEKLKLEAPAQYWKTRSAELKKQGGWYLVGLVIAVLFASSSLFTLLWILPESDFQTLFSNTVNSVKWSFIYVTFLSFLAYIIRVLAKLTFSTFHLSRDAEEREQLTYVYLALNNDGLIDEGERALVLQSLFSRSDSGLLKDDSSPTFPGESMSKVVGNQS